MNKKDLKIGEFYTHQGKDRVIGVYKYEGERLNPYNKHKRGWFTPYPQFIRILPGTYYKVYAGERFLSSLIKL